VLESRRGEDSVDVVLELTEGAGSGGGGRRDRETRRGVAGGK